MDLVEFFKNIKYKTLETLGTVNKNAIKLKKICLNINKEEYLNIPFSFIAFLVGLIDGDGYIQITKTGKGYITIKLVISLHLKDISTLEYIKSVLNLGTLTVYKDNKSPTCKLIINKTDLQEIFFPLLIYHNIYFLTKTRTTQFNTAIYILKNDIKLYDDIPNDIPEVFKLPLNGKGYTELNYFKN